jgi:GH24 family phage-related lysozyme (muramidase)
MKIPSPTTTSVGISNTPLAHFNVSAATPEAFGAGIGRAMQNFAGAIGKMGAGYDARQQKVKTTDGLVELQEFNTKLQTTLIENRRETDPAQSNHFEISEAVITNMTNEFISGLDPSIQESFRARAGAIAETAKLNEFKFGLEQEDAFFTDAIGEAHNTAVVGFGEGNWSREEAKKHVMEVILNTDLSELDKAEAAYKLDLELSSIDYKQSVKAEMELNHSEAPEQALNIIRATEGFRTNAYADTRASTGQFESWRVGYGSDTVVRDDGRIEKVTQNTVITKADAERTLIYRLDNEFIPRVKTQISAATYDGMPNSVKGVLASLAWNYGSLPNSVVKAAKSGDLNALSDAISVLDSNPERRQQEAAIVAKAAMGYSAPDYNKVKLGQDAQGYWTAPNVTYELGGKTRSKPVSQDYVAKISATMAMVDPNVGIKITSGAQPMKGEKDAQGRPLKRTGSTRHDHDGSGVGHTSDFVLTRNGKDVRPGDDPELYARTIEAMAAAGFTGIGHYGWGIHVGGGSPAFWGPSKSADTANADFKAAYDRGRSRAINGIDTDPRFSLVTLEQRRAHREDAAKEIAGAQAAELAAAKAEKDAAINALRFGISDGTAGRAEIEAARASGILSEFTDYDKVMNDLNSKDAEDSDYNSYVQKATDGGFFTQDSADDKNGANAFIKKSGILQGVQEQDEEVAQQAIALAEQQQFIAPNLMSQLNAMAASNDYEASKYAYEMLAELADRAPEQVELLTTDDEYRRLNEWRENQAILTPEQAEAAFKNARDPDKRMVSEARTKEAERLLKEDYGTEFVKDHIDGLYYFNPDHDGTAPITQIALYDEFSAEFKKAYQTVLDPDKAAAIALKQIERNWAKTEVGMPVFMKHPPSKYYPSVDGSFEWMNESIRKDFELFGDIQYQLVSDKQTAQEVDAHRKNTSGDLPSYRVVTVIDGVLTYEEDRWRGEITDEFLKKRSAIIERNATEERMIERQKELQQMKTSPFVQPGRTFPPELDEELDQLNVQVEALRRKIQKRKLKQKSPRGAR